MIKKLLLNPTDTLLGIIFLILYNTFVIFFIIASAIDLIHMHAFSENIFVFMVVCFLLLIPNIFIIRYIYKYFGRLYLLEDCFILKKGKHQMRVNISDIKWIELKRDTRTSVHKGVTTKAKWIYRIRLNNCKEDLDFLITNTAMIDLIETNNLRIMPNEYNEAYQKGQMDLRNKL